MFAVCTLGTLFKSYRQHINIKTHTFANTIKGLCKLIVTNCNIFRYYFKQKCMDTLSANIDN